MSTTFHDVNDPIAVKVYSASTQKAALKDSWFWKSGFVGEDPTKNIVVVKKDLVGKKGDKITYQIMQQLRGYTTPGDQNVSKNIKRLVYLDDSISINQQRTGVNSGGKMSNRRIHPDTRKDSKTAQGDYWAVHVDEELIAKACGTLGVAPWQTINPNASGFDVEGAVDCDGNALRAPSTNRIVTAGAAGTKAALTNADLFSLDLVDKTLLKVTRLVSAGPSMRKMAPLRINGENVWVCLLELTHAFDLKKNLAGRWGQIELAKLQGGFKNSALAQQSLGIYESAAGKVMFFSHEGMPKFNDYGAGGNVLAARSCLFGQAALTFAPGDKLALDGDGLFTTWHEEEKNHGNEVEIVSGMIYGIHKTGYRTYQGAPDGTKEDYGVAVMDAACDWMAS